MNVVYEVFLAVLGHERHHITVFYKIIIVFVCYLNTYLLTYPLRLPLMYKSHGNAYDKKPKNNQCAAFKTYFGQFQ